jgi:hypothetical protein
VGPSWCLLASDERVKNDGTDRSFLALHVVDGAAELHELVKAIDYVLERFGRPSYYNNPIFHVSIAEVPLSRESTSLYFVREAADNQGPASTSISPNRETRQPQASSPVSEPSARPSENSAIFSVANVEVKVGNLTFYVQLKQNDL